MVERRFTFLGLLRPVPFVCMCPNDRLRPWWELRAQVSEIIAAHTVKLEQALSVKNYFFDDFELSLRNLVQVVEALDREWASVCASIIKYEWTPPYIFVSGGTVVTYMWSTEGATCVTLGVDGKVDSYTRAVQTYVTFTSMYVETAALKYLRVALVSQLSVLYAIKFATYDALKLAVHAVDLAKQCLHTTIDTIARLSHKDRVVQITPYFATLDCWKMWLASLLMSQAKYCVSIREFTRNGSVAAFDCEHLLVIYSASAPRHVLDQKHADHIGVHARMRKAAMLSNVGLALCYYAIDRQDVNSMLIASSLVKWFASLEDEAVRDACVLLDAEYTKATNKLPVCLFNAATSIKRVSYSSELTSAVWNVDSLLLPSEVYDYLNDSRHGNKENL